MFQYYQIQSGLLQGTNSSVEQGFVLINFGLVIRSIYMYTN